MTTETVTLLAYLTDSLDERVAKLAKKARKLGVTAPTVTYDNYRERAIRSEYGYETGEVEVVCDATLTYEEIHVSGDWTLLASIETGELGNIVYSASGDDFAHLREADLTCEHCYHNRKRKVHYVVGNAEGERKTVGSSCMKDFLGIDPRAALNFWNSIRSVMDEDEIRSNGRAEKWIKIETLAAWVAREVELAGHFTSRSAAYNSFGELTSTADAVNCNFALQEAIKVTAEDKAKVRPTTKNEETAKLVMAHLGKSLETVELVGVANATDWDYKIASFLTRGFTGIYGKDFNIIVGAIGAALRKIDKDREAAAEEANPVGLEFVDTLLNAAPKDRVEFEGTVIKVSEVENDFSYYGGSSTMIIVKLGSKDKNIKVRWFTTKDMGVNEGDVARFSVKVKNRNDHPKFGTTINSNYPKVI